MADLPPCGVYLTTAPIGEIPAGRLVYFHNHGNPGAGVYLPEAWKLNRARWQSQGTTLPDPSLAHSLTPLPAEGFYRVREAFYCCDNNCRQFEPDLLVQLGYNRFGEGILFLPEWTAAGMAIPDTGNPIDKARIVKLAPLKIAMPEEAHAAALQ